MSRSRRVWSMSPTQVVRVDVGVVGAGVRVQRPLDAAGEPGARRVGLGGHLELGVRGFVGEVEEEGLSGVVLGAVDDDLLGLGRPEIGGVCVVETAGDRGGLLDYGAVVVRVVVVAVDVSDVAVEVVEAPGVGAPGAGGGGSPDPPLSDDRRVVSGFLHHGAERMVGAAGRGADRGGGVVAGEFGPLRRHAVDVRRVDERFLRAVADAVPGDAARSRSVVAGVLVEVVDVPVAHVIDHDEDDVGLGGGGGGEEARAECESGEDAFHGE